MLTEYMVNVALLGAEWVLYLLVLLSVASIALIIERSLVFRRSARVLRSLEGESFGVTAVRPCAPEAMRDSRECSFLAAIEKAAGEHDDPTSTLLAPRLQGVTSAYRRYLERGNAFLGTLGNNAPFIGLFGTVIGVIQAFFQLKIETTGGASAVMGGISEALVATAAGIAVAIPAVVAYNYLTKLSDEYVERFELLAWNRTQGGTKNEDAGQQT